MKMGPDEILDLLGQDRITKDVLQHHDWARESFALAKPMVADSQEFNFIITSYVEHHARSVGRGVLPSAEAFREAQEILQGVFGGGERRNGCSVALQMALNGTDGGLRAVIDEMADELKSRALRSYLDSVYYHVNPLSERDNQALSRSFFDRHGYTLRQFGMNVDEKTFGKQTLATLDYYRQAIERIIGIDKRPRR